MKGWRTIGFNLLLMLLAGVDQALKQSGAMEPIPAQWYPLILGAVNLVNLGLRTITNTPVGKQQ